MADAKITDGERRAIAARIREQGLSECADMAYALGNGCRVGARCEDCRDWMAERLARLVEPQADRDALVTIADRVELLSSDPSRCGREACAYFGHPDCDGCAAYSSEEPCLDLAAKDAARRIRDAIGGVKPDGWIALGEVGALRFPEGRARSMAEWKDSSNGPGSTLDVGTIYAVDEDSYEAVRWVRNNGGLDEVKRRVWESNELHDKLRSSRLKIERLKKALGYADAKNAERREGAKWLKKLGGLDKVRGRMQDAGNRRVELCSALGISIGTTWEDAMDVMRRRLMPDGMEWPRIDGRPVLFCDEVSCLEYGGKVSEVSEFCFQKGRATLGVFYDQVNGTTQFTPVDRCERPDSWERLEDDATQHPWYYCRQHGVETEAVSPDADLAEVVTPFAQDLVRRAKALAGVSER